MIRSAEEVARLRDELDAEGKRLVFTNGCFDLLHAGHVRYLAEARALGDALVVALNSDESVRALKGEGRPLNAAEDRAEVLAALRSVDAVAVFEGERVTGLIEAVRPHVYAKGGDYTPETLNPEERAALDAVGAEIRILSLVPGKSTSATIAAMGRGDGSAGTFRIGVLGSGKGTNLAELFKALDEGQLVAAREIEIAVVISENPEAPILELGRERGVPALHIDPGPEPKRMSLAAQKEMADRLRAADVDLVFCGGFLKILKAPMLEAFPRRIINIHPSLLPKHKGLDAAAKALAAGDREAGCTVHYVDAGVDTGEILGQATVPVKVGDTEETLYARIQQAEFKLLPTVLAQLASGG